MPRCGNCGRDNPEGAVFCQDCGTQIPGASAAPTEDPESPGSGGADRACPACRTPNPASMAFCRQCGARLDPSAPAPVPPSDSEVSCPRCEGGNPAGFNFCQHCGHRLRGNTSPPASPPTPPSGLPVSTATPSGSDSSPDPAHTQIPPRMPTPVRVPTPTAGATGVPLARSHPLNTSTGRGAGGTDAPAPGVLHAPKAGPPDSATGSIAAPPSGAEPVRIPHPKEAAAPRARLVSVNRDGSDGPSYPIQAERFDIGRNTGTLQFEDDGYLSERHARIELRRGRFELLDLDSLNGVFFRIRGSEELVPGIKLIVGMQFMQFDVVPEAERDPAPAVQHGVLVFGTPPKLPWARLRQITTAGIVRDVYHLYRAEVVVGRESGDIVFSDDDFMSRMHAAIRNEGGKAWLVDMNSSNGTYLQVRGSRVLAAGDYLRLGDQLLRFEEA